MMAISSWKVQDMRTDSRNCINTQHGVLEHELCRSTINNQHASPIIKHIDRAFSHAKLFVWFRKILAIGRMAPIPPDQPNGVHSRAAPQLSVCVDMD
jgi:hypothetical protein